MFNIAYDSASVAEQYPGQLLESSETELISHDAASSAFVQVRTNNSTGQYIEPTLPAGTMNWSVTRGPPQSITRDFVTSIRTTLQAGDNAASQLEAVA
jgi:hypothetical protein